MSSPPNDLLGIDGGSLAPSSFCLFVRWRFLKRATAPIEMGRVAENIKIACQKFGLKIPKRITGRETSLQSSRREPMNVSPGGTFLDS